jgi:hypothetical protein
VQVSETVTSLGELLATPDAELDNVRSHLIGQLAAELVASGSEQDLSQAVIAIKDLQRGADQEAAPSVRQSLLSVVSGLLQSVLGNRQSAGGVSLPLTVQDRVLNQLVLGQRNPIDLSNAIGCSPAVTKLALTGLRDAGLVEPTPDSESADDEHVTYELTARGEKRQDDRFFGELVDDHVKQPEYDYGQVLGPLTQVVAELNTYDPVIAQALYPGLHVLTNQVYDPQLRAAAVNELGGPYISDPVVGSTDQPPFG